MRELLTAPLNMMESEAETVEVWNSELHVSSGDKAQ